jgi:enamine deaminase RidA (YjgF/YER057c/UK114 family)
MSRRQTFASDSKWEPLIGYSRAVRVGPYIHVSGTTATDGHGKVVNPEDPAAQAELCIQKVAAVLAAAGASLQDVVRTRMYVADIDHWQAIGEAHRQAFADIRPAATMVEVSRFISPEILVEIEVDAIVSD